MTRSWRTALNNVHAVGTKPCCSICLDHYEVEDTIAWGKHDECNHVFHEECISEWLQNHDDCPLCRVNLLETEKHQDEPHASVAAVAAARAAGREEEGREETEGNRYDIEAATAEPSAEGTNDAENSSPRSENLHRYISSRTSDETNDAENPPADNDDMQRFLSSRTSDGMTDAGAVAELTDTDVNPSAPPMEVGE